MTSIKSSGPIQSSVLTSMNSQADMTRELGGDINAQLAAMVLKHSKGRREDLENVRDLEEANIAKAEKAQIGKMMDQADATRQAGVISGATQMVAGALNIVGAAGVGEGAGDAASKGAEAAAKAAEAAKAAQDGLKATGDVITGLGKMGAASAQHKADEAGVGATKHGHAAEAAKRRLEEVSSDLSEAKALAREGIDFLKDIRRQEAQTNNAALFLKV